MIDSMITDTSENKLLVDYLHSSSTFLKYGYKWHATKVNDDSTTQGLRFVLGNSNRRCIPNLPNIMKTKITCTKYKFPFHVINKIKESVICNNMTANINNINDCLTMLDDGLDRFIIIIIVYIYGPQSTMQESK